ncbi:conserved Plasmodium protein, unknown function [Plasmodium chabaudi chabaudi]|uniref:START domain-containing protein n=1 Tax=Plasmodium chabaudi chabaudi TaxID=31271 RepID=A0A1C6YCN5_PLACU|nr:conserved Plasmodium protein, unknown function [Plasmodium chabaudi chabaudi]
MDMSCNEYNKNINLVNNEDGDNQIEKMNIQSLLSSGKMFENKKMFCNGNQKCSNFCDYFNCSQMPCNFESDSVENSELIVNPCHFCTLDNHLLCSKDNLASDEYNNDGSTRLSHSLERDDSVWSLDNLHDGKKEPSIYGEEQNNSSSEEINNVNCNKYLSGFMSITNFYDNAIKCYEKSNEISKYMSISHIEANNNISEKQLSITEKNAWANNKVCDDNFNQNNMNEIERLSSKKNSLLAWAFSQSLNCPNKGTVEQGSAISIDKDIVLLQLENFSKKVDEDIFDEKVFRAQKLIDHVKKYVEYYINYFKKINDEDMVAKLTEYYEQNCTDKNTKYNINKLKVNILYHFLKFFQLNEIHTVLNDYSYYFSVDPIYNLSTGCIENSHNENNNLDIPDDNIISTVAKQSIQSFGNSDFDGLICDSSINAHGDENCEHTSNVNFSGSNKDKTVNDILKSVNCLDDGNSQNNSVNAKLCQINEGNEYDANYNNIYGNNAFGLNDSKIQDNHDNKKNNSIIIDAHYHQYYNATSMVNSRKFSINRQDSVYEKEVDSKKGNRNMVNIIQKYSRKFKKFKKVKQNKEGWIKDNDKYLDLWHRVDSENNISIHIRGKLPYDITTILSILNEMELCTNWAPFLTSATKLHSLSNSSAIISQLYEYPVIGKRHSLTYYLGANTLEELGCIILCSKAPPELDADIAFYDDLCKKLNINKNGEILEVTEIPVRFRKNKKEVTFFSFKLPQPPSKSERQRSADLCFLIYPLNNGKSTILELFVHCENEFKYIPMKMITFFIKKLVKNMYANIVKACKNYNIMYSEIRVTNSEFYEWLDKQVKKYLKNKYTKLIDSVSLVSYNGHENNDAI